MRVPRVDAARVVHHLAEHGRLAARRRTGVEHGLARFGADHACREHGALALNREQPVLEGAHARQIASMMHPVGPRQDARGKLQLVIREEAAQARVIAAQVVDAHGHVPVLRAIAQDFQRAVLAVGIDEQAHEIRRRAEHDGQVLYRILLRFGPDDALLSTDHTAQHGVYQSRQRLQAHRTRQADGFIHSRHVRHAVEIEELIGAHAQNLAHGRIELLFAVEELVDAPVERQAVFQRAVDQLRDKRPVPVVQARRGQPLVKRQRGVGVASAHVQQRLQRHAARRKVERLLAGGPVPARPELALLAIRGPVPTRLELALLAIRGLVCAPLGIALLAKCRPVPARRKPALLARLSVLISFGAAVTAVAPSVVRHAHFLPRQTPVSRVCPRR